MVRGKFPRHFFADTHLYTWVERGTVPKGKGFFTQEHNFMSVLEPDGPLVPVANPVVNNEATTPQLNI